ncbi:hypothetical protein [Deinococcus rubellus]
MSKKLILAALFLTLLAPGPAQAQSNKLTILVAGMGLCPRHCEPR